MCGGGRGQKATYPLCVDMDTAHKRQPNELDGGVGQKATFTLPAAHAQITLDPQADVGYMILAIAPTPYPSWLFTNDSTIRLAAKSAFVYGGTSGYLSSCRFWPAGVGGRHSVG